MKRLAGLTITVATLSLLVAASLLVQTEDAQGIPAFARKYSMTCTTCHAPAPKLKPYGDEFAGNGFVLKDKDAPRYTVATGDDNLELIRDLPVAIRMDGFMKQSTETNRKLDLTFPYNIKLLSGGALAKNISYYFYFFLSERGEVAGLEDAFIMFNDIGGTELDVYVGQFQVSDPLFKRELRLTYEDYQCYRYEPGHSQMSLTYDRGVMMTYGLPSGTDVIVEILNGNGIGKADDLRLYDDDKYKTFAGRISQDIVEALRLGVFAYYGKEGNTITNVAKIGGVDGTLAGGPLEFNFQFLYREDDNPDFSAPDSRESISGRALMGELSFLPQGDRSRWYAVGLYNLVDYTGSPEPLYHSATVHVGHLLRTNIRAFVENTYFIEDEENRLLLGLMSAF